MDKNKIISVLKDIAYWSMFILLGLLILFVLMEAIIPRQTINVFQVRTYIAEYDTMEPTIKPNDLVFINKVKAEDLEQGDLITFMADINYDGDSEMVTYYVDTITEVSEDLYRITVIAEDADVAFGVITSDNIIGGYAFRIPVLGSIIKFVKSPFGIGAIIVNGLIITGIIILVKNGHKKQETKDTVSNGD